LEKASLDLNKGLNKDLNVNRIGIAPASSIAEALFWAAVIGALMIKCFYFQFSTRVSYRPFSSPENVYMLASLLCVLLIAISPFIFLFRKRGHLAALLLDIFLTILIFADMIYFRYYNTVLAVPLLYQIGLVESVFDCILSLLKWKDVVFIIDIPFFAACAVFIPKLKNNSKASSPKIWVRALSAALIFMTGVLAFKAVYKNVDVSTFSYDNNYIVKKLGLNYFHYYDIKRFIKENYLIDRRLTEKEKDRVESFFNDFNKKTGGGKNYSGIAKGKNLIIVQVEALQQFVINMRTDSGEEVTPNLNRLIKEGIYFDNFYYQIGGGNTSDAEFLANVSLYPIKEGSVYFRYSTNTYFSLGNILKSQGYSTYAFHANNPTFWNRRAMYGSIGFDRFMSNKDFILDEYVGWGLGDASFYRQSLDSIDVSKPFYGFFVSLSSHYPYKYEYFLSYDFNAGRFENTLVGDYLKAINYADRALGMFVEELKLRGLYDDTLLVIYGDHSAIPRDHSADLLKYFNIKDTDCNWIKLQKVPFIIHCPGLEKGKAVTVTGGEIDILPTVANLMGFDAPYAMGKDLLNAQSGYAVLRDNSVITDRYVFAAGSRKTCDANTGAPLSPEEYRDEVKQLQKQLTISDIILQKDALKSIAVDKK